MLSLLPLALLGTYADWDLACSDELKVGGADVYGATPVDSPFEIAVYSDSARTTPVTEASEYVPGQTYYVSRPPPPRRPPPPTHVLETLGAPPPTDSDRLSPSVPPCTPLAFARHHLLG